MTVITNRNGDTTTVKLTADDEELTEQMAREQNLTIQQHGGSLLLLENEREEPLIKNTAAANIDNNVLKGYALMKKIIGKSDSYYIYDNIMSTTSPNIKEQVPEFHKASVNDNSDGVTNNNQQQQQNDNSVLKIHRLMKTIAGCASPFDMMME